MRNGRPMISCFIATGDDMGAKKFSDGSLAYGRISVAEKEGYFAVQGRAGRVETPWLEVVELRALQDTLKGAVDLYLSAGCDYSKASATTQASLNLDVGYETERGRNSLKFRHTVSDTRIESTSSTKADLSRRVFRDRKKAFILYGASYEDNDQLELDYRVTAGAGVGRYFIDNYKMQLVSAIGLQGNSERDNIGEQQKSAEGSLKLEFSAWQFDSPELDVRFVINLYPGITESGRLRGDTDLRFRWELYRDLYWDITAWGSYDNKNLLGEEEILDGTSTGQKYRDDGFYYGLSIGIGWEY
jgi:hypothetical protein